MSSQNDVAELIGVTQQAVQKFERHDSNEVGVMTVFPFLRESVSTMSIRVFGQALMLPTIERGQIALDVDEQ